MKSPLNSLTTSLSYKSSTEFENYEFYDYPFRIRTILEVKLHFEFARFYCFPSPICQISFKTYEGQLLNITTSFYAKTKSVLRNLQHDMKPFPLTNQLINYIVSLTSTSFAVLLQIESSESSHLNPTQPNLTSASYSKCSKCFFLRVTVCPEQNGVFKFSGVAVIHCFVIPSVVVWSWRKADMHEIKSHFAIK